MNHASDYWESIRRIVIPKIGKVVQAFNERYRQNLYVTGKSRNQELVGRVPMGEEEFEEVLSELGFERNPLASLKTRRGDEIEEGSFRKIYPSEYPEWQLHVVIYDGSQINNANTGETFVYAHWEYRWDVHPWKHYRGHDFNPDKGVKLMKKYLNEVGVNFEPIQP